MVVNLSVVADLFENLFEVVVVVDVIAVIHVLITEPAVCVAVFLVVDDVINIS